MIFGVYTGGDVSIQPDATIIIGSEKNPLAVITALHQFQGDNRFLNRAYLLYCGEGNNNDMTPQNAEQYCSAGRKLDLVLCYRAHEKNMKRWTNFIRQSIRRYKNFLGKIQITEEPNNPDALTGGEGSFLNVKTALIYGVIAVKEEVKKIGINALVGFNAVISFDPAEIFWKGLAMQSSFEFLQALDYVGLDFYPDVFRPLPPGLTVREAVKAVLTHFRNQNLAAGNIPAGVPIHITENGWPTTSLRTEARQAEILQATLETIRALQSELNITHYSYFALREAEKSSDEFQYGLLRPDYTPKPAFETYRALIREMGARI